MSVVGVTSSTRETDEGDQSSDEGGVQVAAAGGDAVVQVAANATTSEVAAATHAILRLMKSPPVL